MSHKYKSVLGWDQGSVEWNGSSVVLEKINLGRGWNDGWNWVRIGFVSHYFINYDS